VTFTHAARKCVRERVSRPAWNLPYTQAEGMNNSMGVILAAFFFGMITLGFTLLTVMPLFLVWLMVGVYLEPVEPERKR
jgi:hypothetical protein